MSDVKRSMVNRSPDEWRALVSRIERSGRKRSGAWAPPGFQLEIGVKAQGSS